ncbi:MAG: 1-(5-phosphoribosyl)-5-amino-4-imidazole-carboxylate carboxylase [Planctomycetaceae bacterium]|nr:1-(5-phosphoribosyl)-5-amino-4-imidazole-carboxylate carboxylase [Planctomycetaceae bacterium]
MNQKTDTKTAASSDTGSAQVDLARAERCGYPEVVYCEGKTVEAVVSIFERLLNAGQNALGTRATPEQAEALKTRYPDANHNSVARTVSVQLASPQILGKVAVVTAGTSDLPVAEEAVETLKWIGCEVDLIYDVGVAGPHRIREQADRITAVDAVVVVAGMEGALPSVVGGYVSCPVIAVPTSVGYGANFGGLAALLGMLNSCAANVAVVNIDAGFKGGFLAGMIAQRAANAK